MPPQPYLLRVTPDDTDILEQIMFHGDRVHAIPSLETLLERRVGGEENLSRQTYSLVVDADGQRVAGATIFIHFSTADISLPSEEFLYGDIHEITSTPAQKLAAPANLLTCYSISSHNISRAHARLIPDAGRSLIKALYAEFNNANCVISTCSPIRSVQPFLNGLGQSGVQDPEQLRLLTAAHLMERMPKTPQSFHQSNGAYAGVVHALTTPAKGPDTVNGINVMIGYRYARTDFAMSANQQAWSDGQVPASGYVRRLMQQAGELVTPSKRLEIA